MVPRKEGRVQPVATIAELWRGAPWPRHILLLDNDVLGQPDWAQRLEEMRTGQFRVCFTQGINVRLLTEEAAQALASVYFMDDQFRRRRLYTAWDNRRDEARLFAGLERLVRYGVQPDAIMGLHKDSCKSGHRTRMEVLPHIIRAVFGGIILPMARLIRAVGHDPIG